ncbi:MAG TPA: hypothetical protein VFE82_07825 [Ramlibacter sp.]|jgi:hypothetical protein|uniref:hypothetical protein n=1 Tax=Ramlibacter sp. TaxID=1917967 RepID=UPI002D372FC0|nr:hypothetical protein [Ramlibacter sp.]HZY18374.1 hypothetical protein [Ramlibacter sp.]
MERISGPHFGFYIASYACETGAAGERYLGYAKICRRRPESYWDANCLVKLCGEGLHHDPMLAVAEAERCAVEQLRRIAEVDEAALA